MNPELAGYLAWIVIFLFGAGFVVLAILGVRYLGEHISFKGAKQEEPITRKDIGQAVADYLAKQEAVAK